MSKDFMKVPKGLLTRSTTFDERKPKNVSSENFLRMRKAQSFAQAEDAKRNADATTNISYNEVLYRRYFGFENATLDVVPTFAPYLVKSKKKSVDNVKSASIEKKNRCVVLVDTFSTGAMLAYQLHKAGYYVVRVLSADLDALLDMVPEGLEGLEYIATYSYNVNVESDVALSELISSLEMLEYPIDAILPGAETGVELADRLSEKMKLRTNGTALSEARRNKYVMGETIKAAGVRAVKQLRSSVWGEIQAWIEAWNPNPFKVIVKPLDSAGSDDVTLCLNLEEVKNAFGNIMGKVNGLGLVNRAILVQEYLEGQEYVVDMVSRDGVHKAVAIWAYDRRSANGGQFVCFGQKLLTMEDPFCEELVKYQSKVLTALGILNGPSHGEVKWCRGEPVLIEVGARCHGGDGLWVSIANEVYGFNQVQSTIDAYLNPDDFDKLPLAPVKRKAYGAMKWLINSTGNGIFSSIDPESLTTLTTMPSYRGHQFFKSIGDEVVATYNCFSWMGCFSLAHESNDQLEKDYNKLVEIERKSLFNIDIVASGTDTKPQKRRVAVVDPFSTGAALAYHLSQRDFDVVAVYSASMDQLVNLQNLVPKGMALNFVAVVAFEEDIDTMIRLIGRVEAVMPGTETGVELADRLSERLGLRTNGTALSEARRNKYVMGETIKSAGIRAVKQLRSSDWSTIQAWIEAWKPDPFKVIVKPLDSAGSDDVTLCMDMEGVHKAFTHIIGKVNGLGLVNNAVLVQEYLEGQEYVVDMVSRDGVHKVIALWAYDRRAANGGQFVCHGQRLMTMEEPHCEELVKYESKVLTALGILNGPSHGEVKWCRGEPVLIEVGARCHGGEGAWVASENGVYGYNQLDVSIDAYLNPEAFSVIPTAPYKRHGYGHVLFIVNNTPGIFKGIKPEFMDEIKAMPSVLDVSFFPKVGEYVAATMNCFTWAGLAIMFHKEKDVVDANYNRIREMESLGLFQVTP